MSKRTERRKQYSRDDHQTCQEPAHRRRGYSFCCGKPTRAIGGSARRCPVCGAEYVALSPDRGWAR